MPDNPLSLTIRLSKGDIEWVQYDGGEKLLKASAALERSPMSNIDVLEIVPIQLLHVRHRKTKRTYRCMHDPFCWEYCARSTQGGREPKDLTVCISDGQIEWVQYDGEDRLEEPVANIRRQPNKQSLRDIDILEILSFHLLKMYDHASGVTAWCIAREGGRYWVPTSLAMRAA